MKYKVGDRVRIVKKRVVGMNCMGEMDKWLGKVMTIKALINIDSGVLTGGYAMREDNWLWTDEMIEGLANDEKIVITTDGKETLARLYDGKKVVKSATAKCSPDDEFDFMAGAKIAFERLQKTKESKYFTGKIVCIKSKTEEFTAGKIYEVKCGLLLNNKGYIRGALEPITKPAFPNGNLGELDGNGNLWKFIELVEE